MKNELNEKVDYFEKEFTAKYDENNIPLLTESNRDVRTMMRIITDITLWRQSYGTIKHTDFDELIESYFVDKDEIFEYKLQKRIFEDLEANPPKDINNFITHLSLRIAHKKIDYKIANLLIRTSTNSVQ